MSKSLPPRLRDILERKTDLSEEKRQAYIRLCVEHDYDLTTVSDLPPLHKMLLNYAVAKAKQVVGYTMTAEQAQPRLDQCQTNTCGLFRILNGKMRCAEASCGCFLEEKVKDSTAKCPKGLWKS